MKSILVVDDEFGIADALGDVLTDAGYHVSVARDGSEGLTRLAEDGADLVIVDLMMPVMDGTEMIAALRRDGDHTRVPVILMSAVSRRRIGDVGFDAYLQKPFRTEQLLAMIEALIGPPEPSAA